MNLDCSLLRIVGIHPLFPNIQESEMVTTGFLKVLMRLIGVHLLVLRPVQHGVGFLQH